MLKSKVCITIFCFAMYHLQMVCEREKVPRKPFSNLQMIETIRWYYYGGDFTLGYPTLQYPWHLDLRGNFKADE